MEMRGQLSPEETALRDLTDSILDKLTSMTDAEFGVLEPYLDFNE